MLLNSSTLHAYTKNDTDTTSLSFQDQDLETLHTIHSTDSTPQDRGARIIKDALRRVPIAPDPSPVSVLFEDDHVIAVSKPAGIRSAPRHRYEGQSMMQRVLSHMGGAAPLVVHRWVVTKILCKIV